MQNIRNILISIIFLIFISGCSNKKALHITPENNIINKQSSLQIRDIQVRTFYDTTKEQIISALTDILLDDGYFINMIDIQTGIISSKNSNVNPQLNLVSTIKHLGENDYLVRFSLNAIDKSLAFKSYYVVEDDLIYRYLFDKLRKSLFLNKNFYKTNNKNIKLKDTNLKVSKPKVVEKVIEKIVYVQKPKTTTKKVIVKQKIKKLPMVYAIEFIRTLNKKLAKQKYLKLKKEAYNVRIHNFNKAKVVRLGRYKTKKEALHIKNTIIKTYPNAKVIGFIPRYK